MHRRPYADAADVYTAAGWPVVLPVDGKGRTPTGWTGYRGPTLVPAEKTQEWKRRRGDQNITLRLPPHVVGLDVDAYRDPVAAKADLDALGPLPPTWRSSARLLDPDYDGLSGIRLYRLGPQFETQADSDVWRGNLGTTIDIIRFGHRQVVCWPSTHPHRHSTYRWFDERSGELLREGHVPRCDDVPLLPDGTAALLLKPAAGGRTAPFDRPGGGGGTVRCRKVPPVLDQAMTDLSAPHRHDSTARYVLRLVRLDEQGHHGAAAALDTLRDGFVRAVADSRWPGEATAEYTRMVEGAAQKVRDSPTSDTEKGCCGPGTRKSPSEAASPSGAPPVSQTDALAVFKKWLHLDDTAPVLAVAATYVANQTAGDPVWLLVVGAPSGGKTETVGALMGLPGTVAAATVTEAALLSGTSAKDKARDATGGLLRQVGDLGIVVCKDFTSVLAQNKDTARAALAALREVYDGSWDRPVGTDGGKVLHWKGKCGLVAGVTPNYDRYGSVVNALGDRFLLLRMPDVKAADQAKSALAAAGRETAMRQELAAAMHGLVAGSDPDRFAEPLGPARDLIVSLSSYAARTRTAVERDGYSGELLVMPQPEGPARIAKQLAGLYRGLLAVGCDETAAVDVMGRVAMDCASAMRTKVIRTLMAAPPDEKWQRTSALAESATMVTKTTGRVLDDLTLLGVVQRRKSGEAANSPDQWCAAEWLRGHWPPVVRQRYTSLPPTPLKRGEETTTDSSSDDDPLGMGGSPLSHFAAAPDCAAAGCDWATGNHPSGLCGRHRRPEPEGAHR